MHLDYLYYMLIFLLFVFIAFFQFHVDVFCAFNMFVVSCLVSFICGFLLHYFLVVI
jgi:hypothetical protein